MPWNSRRTIPAYHVDHDDRAEPGLVRRVSPGFLSSDPAGNWVASRHGEPVSVGRGHRGRHGVLTFQPSDFAARASLRACAAMGKFTTARMASLSFTLQSVQPAQGGPEITVEALVRSWTSSRRRPRADRSMERHFRDGRGGDARLWCPVIRPRSGLGRQSRPTRLWLTAIAPGSATVTVSAVDDEGDGVRAGIPGAGHRGAPRLGVSQRRTTAMVDRVSCARSMPRRPTPSCRSWRSTNSAEEYGPATLNVPVGAAVQFNSVDLEDGNPTDRDIADGVGQGTGSWRLELESAGGHRGAVLPCASTSGRLPDADGPARSPRIGNVHRVAFFNPRKQRRSR